MGNLAYKTATGAFYNGVLPLDFGERGAFKKASIIGGPYDNFPGEAFFGVSVRSERMDHATYDVWLSIRDFNVPDDEAEVVEALKAVIEAIYEGRIVYMGCMGGIGRTGLIMALLVKATGEEDPIGYVRQHYYEHAVETPEQIAYVNAFDVSELEDYIDSVAWAEIDELHASPSNPPELAAEPLKLNWLGRALRWLITK